MALLTYIVILLPIYFYGPNNCLCLKMSNFSERIVPVAAKWVNFDFLGRLLFQKWIVLECNSKCFTLRVLPLSKCSGNSSFLKAVCNPQPSIYLFLWFFFSNVGTKFSNGFCTPAFNGLPFPSWLIPAYDDIQTTHTVTTTRVSTRTAVF